MLKKGMSDWLMKITEHFSLSIKAVRHLKWTKTVLTEDIENNTVIKLN